MTDSTRPTAQRRAAAWRLPLRAVNSEPAPWAYRALGKVVHAVVPIVARRHWSGREHIPSSGGALVVANHVGNFDVLVLGEYLIWAGRWPRFLGKSEIWKVPGLGWLARQCEQIPVVRHTAAAADSLIHAKAALRHGKLVTIYPEGTITADPDGWPMTAKTGAARLALETGVPVIPVAQIGAQQFLGGKKLQFRKLLHFGRRDVHVMAGPPINLDHLREMPRGREAYELASVTIMDTLTAMVEQLRGEEAPEGRWDMRAGERIPRRRQA